MSGERLSIWDDENVKSALADGRSPMDIACLNCRKCGHISYYNEGSSFTCSKCGTTFYCATEDEDISLIAGPVIVLDEVMTLQDVADAECEDY